MAPEWRDETDRWLLGYCWLPLAVGNLMLAALGGHRWELPGNYPVLTVVMVIYYYVERTWRIIVAPEFLYNIYNHE